jgi:hypothetical protein
MSYQVNFDSSLILRTVKRPRGSSNRLIPYYECKCANVECGNITFRDVNKNLKWSGYCRPCSNRLKLAKARTVPNPADGEPYEALFNSLKKCANEKGKDCSLTFSEFVGFTKFDQCHYCYTEIKWTVRNLTKNGSRYNLDRLDNDKGYHKDNCVPCCWRCNNGKRNLFSYEEWFGMTEYLRNKKDIP